MPKIFLFDESDKKLIENARSRDAGMFAHVAIDPNRLATQPMANPEYVPQTLANSVARRLTCNRRRAFTGGR
jgi:hypothetical protein